MDRDDWSWNEEGPMHPLFDRESRRREYLRARANTGALSPMEAKELADGYVPFAYVGATYHGHAVSVTRLMDGTDDRTPYLLNNPNRWLGLDPALSTRNWPQGPPGWVGLVAGVHWDPQSAPVEGADRFRRLTPPWDVEFQRKLSRQ